MSNKYVIGDYCFDLSDIAAMGYEKQVDSRRFINIYLKSGKEIYVLLVCGKESIDQFHSRADLEFNHIKEAWLKLQ